MRGKLPTPALKDLQFSLHSFPQGQTWFSPDLSTREHEEKVQPLAEGVVMLPSWLPHIRLVPEFFQYLALFTFSDVCCAQVFCLSFPRFCCHSRRTSVGADF